MTWTSNLTNNQILALVTKDIDDNKFSYQEMLEMLQTVVADGVSSTELNDLKTIYTNSTTIFESKYLQSITYNVVYSNPANTKWWAGVQSAADVETLGDMAGGMSEQAASHLVDKWYLGLDMPMPISGGDTAKEKASTNAFTYADASGPLFVDGIAATDVNQGSAGTCYLVASIGAIANANPSLISGNVIDNGNGTYGVRFYLDGAEAYTTVNKSLPVTQYNTVAFTSNLQHSLTGESWVSIFEKAYVQLNQQANVQMKTTWTGENSYQAVEGGWAYPIKEITNLNYSYYSSYYSSLSDKLSTAFYYSKNAATYKQTIIDALKNGSIGWLASFGKTTDAGNALQNLVAGHAFMLIGYDSSDDTFIIRNPWGGTGNKKYNPEFKASINDFWNSDVKGVVALSEPATSAPVFSYTIASNSGSSANAVKEGENILFTITRSGTASAASTVYLSSKAGTADNTDYKPLDKFQLNFAAFETSKTVTVTTHNDTLVEETESFSLDLLRPSDAVASVSATAYIKNITPKEYTYTVASSAGTATTAVSEGNAITFTVKRNDSGTASTVYLSTANGTTSNSDYQGLDKLSVDFAPNETTKTITVDTLQDDLVEGSESFSLNLSKNLSDTTPATTATGYIKDKALPFYNYTITSSAAGSATTGVTEGSKATFTITRSGSGSASDVYVSTAAGTAAADDFTGFNGKAVTFAANQTVVTLDVPIVQDWWLESDEFFTLKLYLHKNDTTYASSGIAFIKDKPFSGYNYTITSNTSVNPVTEGDAVVFTITRNEGNTASTVYVSTVDGSADSSDYKALSLLPVTFAPYETTKTVKVETLTDSLTEDNEDLWLTLYRNVNDSSYSEYGNAVIADGVASRFSYALNSSVSATAPAPEGGNISFTITRSGSGSASTVLLNTKNDSASVGKDFQPLAGNAVTFAPYETTKTITIRTNKDPGSEGTESFLLDLFTSEADLLSGKFATFTNGYIQDTTDTSHYTYSITGSTSDNTPVSEGEAVTFTITRSGSGSSSSVYLSTEEESAEGKSDFQSLAGQEIKFAANETSKTVTVNTYQDAESEGTESFWLNLYTSAEDALANDYATYTSGHIKDGLTTRYDYTITSNAASATPVTEGEAITFTITRGGSGTASTVYVSTVDDVAWGGSDFRALSGQEVKFSANETIKTVTVHSFKDEESEGTESFWFELYTHYDDFLSENYAAYSSGAIRDAATGPHFNYTITSNAGDNTPVKEGDPIHFTITRSGSGAPSTVYVRTQDHSAEGGSDFRSLAIQEVKFADHETSKTVTVNTYQDADTENQESFWFDLFTGYANIDSENVAAYASGSIQDVQVDHYSYTIANSGATNEGEAITFTITRSGSGTASTVYVDTSDDSAWGDDDFKRLEAQEVRFAANETSRTITVHTYQDTVTEGAESFWFNLYTSPGNLESALFETYDQGIIQDVVGPAYTYSITSSADSTTPVLEGNDITFTITRSGSGTASTVYVGTSDHTAMADSDLAPLYAQELSFAAQETSKTVTVTTYSDAVAEGVESFWFQLFTSHADAESSENPNTVASGYIQNVTLPDYSYTITAQATDTHPTEEGSLITFTIARSGTGSASTVYVSTQDNTAWGDSDFQALSGQAVTFAANQSSQTLTVNTLRDGLTEGKEAFWVTLYTSYADVVTDNYTTYTDAYIQDAPTGSTMVADHPTAARTEPRLETITAAQTPASPMPSFGNAVPVADPILQASDSDSVPAVITTPNFGTLGGDQALLSTGLTPFDPGTGFAPGMGNLQTGWLDYSGVDAMRMATPVAPTQTFVMDAQARMERSLGCIAAT
ncbi:MAG: hypothetical protein HQL98_13860 [Magnetococcales bacterium]|nr:hypothetical protein [Magnetococcales bacterium]